MSYDTDVCMHTCLTESSPTAFASFGLSVFRFSFLHRSQWLLVFLLQQIETIVNLLKIHNEADPLPQKTPAHCSTQMSDQEHCCYHLCLFQTVASRTAVADAEQCLLGFSTICTHCKCKENKLRQNNFLLSLTLTFF